VELCQSILSYLSRADLVNLCLVHSSLRMLAEPYLYASIQLKWDPDRRQREPQPHLITSVLRSLLRRPQLATYVREVSLVGSYFHNSTMNVGPLKILVSENELDQFRAFVMKTTIAYRWSWLEGLQNGVMDAFVAVLLSQPLRLTSLSVKGSFLCDSHFIGLVLRSMIFRPDADDCGLQLDLRQLETVTLQTFCDHFRLCNNARNTADLLPILYLPSIRQFSASIDNPTTFTWPAISSPSPSRLHSLTLYNIREPFLGQLLSVTNHVQFLHWQWYYYHQAYETQFCTRTLDLTQITESLSRVQETLTHLVVSAINQNDPEPLSLTIRGSMHGLVEFKKLKKLTLPFIFLVGTWSTDLTKRIDGCLPPSLESLTITDDLYSNDECEWYEDDTDLFIVLELWLKTYQATTPYIRDVNVPVSHTDENITNAQRLAELTKGVVRVQFLV
jgi:hypothetical protein